MRKYIPLAVFLLCFTTLSAQRQVQATGQRGLTATANSPYAVMTSTPVNAVEWTAGFWGDLFEVFSKTSVQSMWETWQSEEKMKS